MNWFVVAAGVVSLLIILAGLGAIILLSRAIGEANAIRDEAKKDRDNAIAAGKVMAQNRTTDDSANRLRKGNF